MVTSLSGKPLLEMKATNWLRISSSIASSAVVLIAVSFMPCLRTAWRTIVLNCSTRLFSYHCGPKFLIRFTESVICKIMMAWNWIGTPSLVMVSSISVSNFCGCIDTSTPSVVQAVIVNPVLTGSGSTPPCPKISGFSTKTISCPASGCFMLHADVNSASKTIALRDFIRFSLW